MNSATKRDLLDLSDIMESLVAKLGKLSDADLVDVGARLKPVAKHCEEIDDAVKALVKKKLGDATGTVKGDLFIAEQVIFPVTRFNQAKFKADKPAMFARYQETKDEGRITFKTR